MSNIGLITNLVFTGIHQCRVVNSNMHIIVVLLVYIFWFLNYFACHPSSWGNTILVWVNLLLKLLWVSISLNYIFCWNSDFYSHFDMLFNRLNGFFLFVWLIDDWMYVNISKFFHTLLSCTLCVLALKPSNCSPMHQPITNVH